MLRSKRLTCARAFLIGLMAASASACGTSEPADESDGLEDLGVAESDLGVALASCSTAGSSGFGAGQVLTLSLAGGPSTIMLSASAGKITVNGWKCVNSSGAALVTTGVPAVAVKKIVVTGDAAVGEKVIVDMLPGSFGSTILSGATGSGIQIDLGAGAGDSFMMRGTNAKDSWVMGKSAAGDVYVDTTGDSKADIKVTGAENYSVTLLALDDTFTARGGAVKGEGFTAGVTSLNAMSAAISIYGGDGADTLTGGDGNDTINGGAGNDTFKTSTGASADGNDVYIGGAGNDTMDYSGRTSALTVDIGPHYAYVAGSVDLTTLTYPGDLDAKDIVVSIDGAADDTVTFATPADEADVVAQINAQVGATVAALDQGNHLILHAVVVGNTSAIDVQSGSALAVVGIGAGAVSGADADDGQGGESDDVTWTVENLIGGTVADTLVGSDQVNIISGGTGNDIIDGYPNATCPVGGGDQLNGNDGDDKFVMDDYPNCGAILTGGAGNDSADFSLRVADLTVTIEGTANDGDGTANSGAGEKANVKTDVEIVLGGDGDDHLTGSTAADELHGGNGDDVLNGGAGNDTLYGGPGNDEINGAADDDVVIESGNDTGYSPAIAAGTGDDLINGGAGVDKVSYASRTADLTITLCVNAATTGAPTGASLGAECSDSDGDPAVGVVEADNLVNVEWVVGGTGDDDITGSTGDEILEGGAGADTLHGGDGADSLYGDGGDDLLYGEDGDDYVEGGTGDDLQDGGLSDGDVCISDASDVTAADPVPDCEL